MSQAFGYPAFAVDTHVHRCMYRWGLSSGRSVVQTEKDAKRLFPKDRWSKYIYKLFFMVENIALLRILTRMIAQLQLLLEEGHYLNKLLYL